MNLYISSDNAIILDQLQNAEGQLVDDAICTARVTRYDGLVIADNINMINQGAGTGRYVGRLTDEDAATLEEGVYYDVFVEADRSGTVKATFKCRMQAKYNCAC